MAEDPKVTEFRETNTRLIKEKEVLTKENEEFKKKFEGIDPDVVRAQAAELETLRKAKPDERVKQLETELATEKAARAAAQATIDASVLRSAVTDKFLKAGGRPNALDFMVTKAKDVFTVENGVPVGKVFDPDNPGVKLSVDAFIRQQIKESDFAFKPSNGGGADPKPSGGRPGVKELANPTPEQLGDPAIVAAIRRGELKVV
jgi:hypothetical protein